MPQQTRSDTEWDICVAMCDNVQTNRTIRVQNRIMKTPEQLDCERFSGDRKGILPNAENIYHVAWDKLPLTCPMPEMSLWNSHPQVFIPLHETDEYSCMYCGATYILDKPIPDEVLPAFANRDIEKRYLERVERIRHQ